ncbi:MAG: YCF48-related protein [Cytophagaceae bacterium]
MKKIYIIISILIIASGQPKAFGKTLIDTVIQVPSGVKAYLTAVSFVQNKGIIVGDSGRILRSIDKGHSWKIVKSPSGAWLSAVQFVNASVAYAVGDSGTVLKSVNGGETWHKLQAPGPFSLSSISFVDANHGYVGGSQCRFMYKTRDGGKTWTTISLGTKFSTSLNFSDTATGYVLETFLWLGRPCWPVVKTSDGGKTFTQISCVDGMITKLKMVDKHLGFAISSRAIYKMTDGNVSGTVSTVHGTTDFSFSDAGNGFAVGDTILQSSNGGNSWSVFHATAPHLTSVYSFSKTEAIAVGPDGVIVRISQEEKQQHNSLAGSGHSCEVKIYPNPCKESLSLHFSGSGDHCIKLYNHFGHELRSAVLRKEENTIGLADLPPGIYYLNLYSDNQTSSHTIIKE